MPGPDLDLLRRKAFVDALLRFMSGRGIVAQEHNHIELEDLVIDTDNNTINIKYAFVPNPGPDDEEAQVYERGYNAGFHAGQESMGYGT